MPSPAAAAHGSEPAIPLVTFLVGRQCAQSHPHGISSHQQLKVLHVLRDDFI